VGHYNASAISHDVIDNPKHADALIHPLVHNALGINLREKSMRAKLTAR
jgi:hypothetical protein